MPAQPMTSGPLFLYVGVNNSAAGVTPSHTVRFLGITETGLDWDTQIATEPVRSDLAGSILPHDDMYQGEGPVALGTTLTVWDEAVLQLLERVLNYSTKARGVDGALDRGSLILTENMYWPFYIVRGHRQKQSMIQAGMLNGRVYPYCKYDSVSIIEGRRANKKRFNFIARSKYNGKTGGWDLYDDQVSIALGATVDIR